ncbi:rho-related GTP-binding protein RhoN-like [Diadema antillarum]|uniref:rho-related GTP-binding protein RhoN-like n=2 Tax=Diadema antillarum TaxID=105358 RepID=UPI003A847786
MSGSRFSFDFGESLQRQRPKLTRRHSLTSLDEHSRCKVVMVGDSKSGKSALINAFVGRNDVVEIYKPTTFDRYTAFMEFEKYSIELNVWDTGGSAEYDFLRPLAYQDTDVIIICFDISEPSSLDRISLKWIPEIRKHCQTCHVILAGCKSDLRNNIDVMTRLTAKKLIPVSHHKGSTTAQQIKAVGYVESSARTNTAGVREVFEMAALATIGKLSLQKSYTDLPHEGKSRPTSLSESLRLVKKSPDAVSSRVRVKSTVIEKDPHSCPIL